MDHLMVKHIPGTFVSKIPTETVFDELLNDFPTEWKYQWQNPTKPVCNICGTSIEKLDKLVRILRPSRTEVDMLVSSWECGKCSRLDDTWPVITAKIRR